MCSSWCYACSIYGEFNDCISHVDLGEAYVITKDVELYFKNPEKENMYELFILAASRFEFRWMIVVYMTGQILF